MDFFFFFFKVKGSVYWNERTTIVYGKKNIVTPKELKYEIWKINNFYKRRRIKAG